MKNGYSNMANNSVTNGEINFATNAARIEGEFYYGYQEYLQGLSPDDLIDWERWLSDNLNDYINNISAQNGNKELYKKQMEAYRMAHYGKYRQYQYYSRELIDRKEQFDETCADIEQLGGQSIPTNSYDSAIPVLKDVISKSAPKECGDINFLQQIEDVSQFRGWFADLNAQDYYLTKHDTVKNRTAIQEENGIVS